MSTTSKVWEHIGGASVGVYDSDRHLALAAGDDDPTACRCRCGQPFTFNHALGARGAYECSAGHVAWRAVDGALLYERCTCGERMEYTVSVPPLGSALRKLRCPKCEPVKAGKLACTVTRVDDGVDLFGWWRDENGDVCHVSACERLNYVESHVPGKPLESVEWPAAALRRRVAAGWWTRVDGPSVQRDGSPVDNFARQFEEAYGFAPAWAVSSASGAAIDDLAELHAVPRDPREHNLATARAAEATPPNVRGLLSFGQRRGPAWERFRVALAGEVERCNCRPEPEVLTSARIEAIAREVVSRD